MTLYISSNNDGDEDVPQRLRSFLRQFTADGGLRVRVRDIAKHSPFRQDGDIRLTPCIVLRDGDHSHTILGNLRNTDALSLALADSNIRPV